MPASEDSGSIYGHLRTRLITADLKQGQKLKPELLRKEYGCAASTIRESLFRLSSDGFIDFIQQRGFRVPNFTAEGMRELCQLRSILEQQGMRLSIERGGLDWESRLTAAHHKLAHIERKIHDSDDVRPFMALWTKAEWQFHHTLISDCGSSILIATYQTIYDRFRQHQAGLSSDFGFRIGNIAEHEAILDAALAHDPDQCAAAIERHLLHGTATGNSDPGSI